MYSLSNRTKPIILPIVEINDKATEMELDTGAALSVVGESTFHALCGSERLEPSSVTLRTYNNQELKVLGSVNVRVTYGTQVAMLPLLVV